MGDATHDLYHRYGRQIYAYCFHRLRSREEAEDAVQTTFMNAFRSLQRGTTTEYEQAWLFKIAHNVCIARHSNTSRRLRLEVPNDFEALQEVVAAPAVEEPLELMGIEDALERMPENQRRAILLREWQGLSYREISAELELSQAAVEMLIFRARRTLAGALEQPADLKPRRVGRKVGSFGSLLGAGKTVVGGGAATKAAAVAAAAFVVVGQSASHTLVRRPVEAAPVQRAASVQDVDGRRLQARRLAVATPPERAAGVRPVVHAAAPHASRTAPRTAPAGEPDAPPPPASASVPAVVVLPAPPSTTLAPRPENEPPQAPLPSQPSGAESLPTPVPLETQPDAAATAAPVASGASSDDPQPEHGRDGEHASGRDGDTRATPAVSAGGASPVDPSAPTAVMSAETPDRGKALALGRNKQQP